jgi:protein required for attachment to host cells
MHLVQDSAATRDQGTERPERAHESVGTRRPSHEQTDFHQLDEIQFAVDAADMLKCEVLAHNIDGLLIVAAPRTLGELRKHFHVEVERRVIGKISKDVASRPTDEILAAIASNWSARCWSILQIKEPIPMQILVNTDNAIEGSEGLAERIEAIASDGLSRFSDRITRVELHLSDTNGERGGVDKRCVLEVRPKGLDPVVTTDQADTVEKVVLSATHKMVHLLETTFGKLSARRDH